MTYDTVYVIIPTAELTQSMINRSLNRKVENIRTNDINTKSLLEVETPPHSVYDAYQWYDCHEMSEILMEAEWQD